MIQNTAPTLHILGLLLGILLAPKLQANEETLHSPESESVWFGASLDTWGKRLVVGGSEGNSSKKRAYVFVRNNEQWQLENELIADKQLPVDIPQEHYKLFPNVAISGETILIAPQLGTIYFFELQNGWQEVASFTKANDQFGFAIDIDDDYAAVSDTTAGKVYLYQRLNGSWQQTSTLEAEEGWGAFGSSVAIDHSNAGTFVAVGDHLRDGLFSDVGEVIIWKKSGNQWNKIDTLDPSDATKKQHFGYSISLHSGNLAIGSPRDSDAAFEAGAVYLYRLKNGLFSFQDKLYASDADHLESFGHSLHVFGNNLLIGAHRNHLFDLQEVGKAYLFQPTASNVKNWCETQTFSTVEPTLSAMFSYALAIGTDYSVSIGAPRIDSDTGQGTIQHLPGALNRFEITAENTSQIAVDPSKPLDSSGRPQDRFGHSASIMPSGNFFVAGAPHHDILFKKPDDTIEKAHPNAGGAYGYRLVTIDLPPNIYYQYWHPEVFFTADLGNHDQMGYAVTATETPSTEYAIVGAPGDNGVGQDKGAIHLFHRSKQNPPVWHHAGKTASPDLQSNALFGWSLDSAEGKYVIAGAPGSHLGGDSPNVGLAYLYEINIDQLTNELLFPCDIVQPNTYYGYDVSVALDGNQNPIVAIGAPGYNNNGKDNAGRVYAYRYQNGQWDIAKLHPPSPAASDFFGFSVDTDGDRILVGAPGRDDSANHAGQLSIYRWTGNAWTLEASLTPDRENNLAFNSLGAAVEISGNRALASARYEFNNGRNGAIYQFTRNDQNQWHQQRTILPPSLNGGYAELFGFCLDSNNQGQLLISAPGNTTHGVNSGKIYLYGK